MVKKMNQAADQDHFLVRFIGFVNEFTDFGACRKPEQAGFNQPP
jgi:hypothetical protein